MRTALVAIGCCLALVFAGCGATSRRVPTPGQPRPTDGRSRQSLTSLSVEPDEPAVTETENGWLVRFEVIGPDTMWNATAGPDHTDPGMYRAQYLLADGRVWRAIGFENVSPRQAGSVVHCAPVVD